MKAYKKIINIIIIMLISLICCSNVNYAYDAIGLEDLEVNIKEQDGQSNLKDPIANPDFFKPEDTTGNNTKFIELGSVVIGALRVLGTVVSVITLMIIGLKYILGTASEKANYRETLIPYLVGAIMVFTIPHVLGIVYELIKGIQFGETTK